jgi:serine/threonine-protein kinase
VLTGKLPFEAKSAMDYIQLHVMGKPIPLNQRVAGRAFPPLLERIVDRALAKRPEERFASAEDFGRAMQSLLDGATELAPLARVPPLSTASLERPPALAPAAAGAFVPVPAPVFVPAPPPSPQGPEAIAFPPARPPAQTNSPKPNILLLVGVAILFLLLGVALALGLLKLIAGR